MTTTKETNRMKELVKRKEGKIYFVTSVLPGPDSEFVELEDANGAGLGLGRWVRISSDLYALEIDDPRSEFNTSTNLDDDEIELVVAGLARIARARSTQIHSLAQVEAAKDLLDKLGFPFVEEASEVEEETTVLPEGETEYPVRSTATADGGTEKEA